MNQKNLWIALITLIVAIFVFAQVYILFAVTQTNNRLVQLEDRIDKQFTEIDKRITDMESRFDKRFNLIEIDSKLSTRTTSITSPIISVSRATMNNE